MQSIVAICAHVDDHHLHTMVEEYRRVLGGDRVYVLFDTTKTPAPSLPNTRTFSTKDCLASEGYVFHKDNWYNVECKLGKLRELVLETGASHAWMLESDVACDGDISVCLDRAAKMKEDFLAVKVREYDDEPDWYWWESLAGEVSVVPVKKRRGCFFPVTRYSKRMLNEIWANRGTSSGFCEVYVPTLAVWKGFSIANIPESMVGDVWLDEYTRLPGRGDHRLYHKFVPPEQPALETLVCSGALVLLVGGIVATRFVQGRW